MHGGALTEGHGTLRTGAVVVFFHPDAACVERANRLSAVMRCVVVDNTPASEQRGALDLSPEVVYLPNGENVGIATAINQGVNHLIGAGYEFVFLFDQDSEPPAAMLTELPALLAGVNRTFVQAALIGPAYDDARLGGVAPFVRFRIGGLERVAPVGNELIDVDFLISSGSCLDVRCWSSIGAMDDSLFIDFVDVEWCLRAKRSGFRVLGVPWIRMRHELGCEPVRVLGRIYPMHSPLRHYYLFRNAVALIKRRDLPFRWKSAELLKLPVRLVVYALMPNQRKAHLSMALRGFYDGCIGRMGRFESR
jgi:rhamnosyltransferase